MRAYPSSIFVPLDPTHRPEKVLLGELFPTYDQVGAGCAGAGRTRLLPPARRCGPTLTVMPSRYVC